MEFLQFLEPWMIPIVIMICVTLIVIITSVTKIITTSMTRKEGRNLSENQEFLDALRDFKENIDRRVANLEEIASAEREDSPQIKSKKSTKRGQSAIELKIDDKRSRTDESNQSSNLKNMLNQ